jgi:hypothetical protein
MGVTSDIVVVALSGGFSALCWLTFWYVDCKWLRYSPWTDGRSGQQVFGGLFLQQRQPGEDGSFSSLCRPGGLDFLVA